MIERAWLLALSEDETRFYLLPTESVRDSKSDGTQLAVSSPSALTRQLAQPGEVFRLEQRRANQPAVWPAQWIDAGVQVILPLVSDGKLQGIYLLGRKLSDDVYQRQELDLLRTLANQASVSISNARLYEQVHSLSQELEETVQERTQELRDFVSVVYHELSTPIIPFAR
jgi:transcriptional regulator with GAF, ATPase, and Fis domain